MIAEREEAKLQREAEQKNQKEETNPLDALMEQHEEYQKRKAHPSLHWKSNPPIQNQNNNSSDYYAKRRKRHQDLHPSTRIKSLYQLCIDYLVSNFDHVDSLGPIETTIRNKIAEQLVGKGKFNGAAFEALIEPGMSTLEIIDGANVTQDQLCLAFSKLLPFGLERICLHHAGRCLGKQAIEKLLSYPSSQLMALSIAGAYTLHDESIAKIIQVFHSTLSSLEFRACPNVGHQFCASIATYFSSPHHGRLLELSLQDLKLSPESLQQLSKSDSLIHLRSLTLQNITNLSDDVFYSILQATCTSTKSKSNPKHDTSTNNDEILGYQLQGLDLNNNPNLSDNILSHIRTLNLSHTLQSLELENIPNLTREGLEAFFTYDIPGIPKPPCLKRLNLGNNAYQVVNDNVVKLAAKASSLKLNLNDDDDNDFTHHLSSLGGFVYLNLCGASITDDTLEILATTCSTSLQELNLSFCPYISDKGMGYMIVEIQDQFTKVHVWGCAQLTEELWDGHDRVFHNEKGRECLDITGVWMKKSGGSSVR